MLPNEERRRSREAKHKEGLQSGEKAKPAMDSTAARYHTTNTHMLLLHVCYSESERREEAKKRLEKRLEKRENT